MEADQIVRPRGDVTHCGTRTVIQLATTWTDVTQPEVLLSASWMACGMFALILAGVSV